MDNPYAKYLAPQAAPQATSGVIYGRPKAPDPIELERLELSRNSDARAALASDRAAANQDRQASAAERAVATQERVAANTNIDNASGLRKEFTALPEVKDFSAMRSARNRIGQLATKPNPTPQDDMAMIFSYMKLLDPGSVVREGEYATAQNAGSIPDNLLSAYNKAVEGNPLTPDKRQNMAQAAVGVYKTQRQVFNDRAKYYREIAQKQGIDPDLVTGFYVDKPEDQARQAQSREAPPIGEIQFGAEPGGKLPGAGDYAREVEQGVQNGTIKNADDVAAVARKYGFGEPDRAQTEQVFEALRKGARFGGAGLPEYASVQKARQDMATERGNSVLDPAVRGAADALTLGLADEIAGVGNAIATGGNVSEQIALQRATDQFDEQNNFRPRLAGQLLAGLALPTGGATGVADLAKVGGAYGAAYGFGSANGSLGDRLGGAAIGGVTGAGASAALGALGNGLASRLANRAPRSADSQAGREVYQAAVNAGITDADGLPMILPADVGGPMTRRLTSGASQTVFGSRPVIQAAEAAQDRAGQRLSEIASASGQPARQEVLGEAGQNAAQGYIDRTGQVAREQYGAARNMARNSQIQGVRAVSNIDNQLSELAATSNTDAPLIAGLQRLRADLANEGDLSNLSIDAMRRLRTSTRAEAQTEGLRATDYNRRAQGILSDLSADIESQLPNRRAIEAFRNADRAYAERLDTIDNVMSHVIGNDGGRSAEDVANRLIDLGRKDSARLRSFLNAVEPEEAGIVRGSLIQEMGRSSSGQQNAAGNSFSLQTFLTNWDKMPDRTKDLLFRGEHRQAIEGLARYAEAARATRSYANSSNTAGAVNSARIAGAAASGVSAVGSLGATAVIENVTGRLLGSRRFAQWLARPPQNPARLQTWANRLGTISTREPAIAQDILPLREALQSAISRAAASDQEQDRRQ